MRQPLLDSDSDEEVEAYVHEELRQTQRQRFGEPRLGPTFRYGRPHEPSDYRIKMDIPNFDGYMHIESFLDWLQTVENFFGFMQVLEHKHVKIVAYKLRGGASAWWEQLQVNRKREGKESIRSWPRMRQLLRNRFLPADYDQILYQ